MKLKQFIQGHRVICIVILCGFLLLVGGGVAGGVALHNHFDSMLPENASFRGVNLSRMKSEEATKAINEQLNTKVSEASIAFDFQGEPHTLKAGDYDFRFDPQEVFNQAKKFNFKDSSNQLDIPPSYDKQKLVAYFETLEAETKVAPTAFSYRVEGTNLIAVPGAAGVTFDKDKAVEGVIERVQAVQFDQAVTAVEQPVTDEIMNIDFDKIYGEVKAEMQNATTSIDGKGVLNYVEPVQGIDFDLEAAKKMLDSPQAEYVVPLKITPPQVTVEQLKAQHNASNCPDLIQNYTTSFSAGDANRNFNIQRAASIINGTILQPGEAFSFHRVVKGTGKAQGYKEATVYSPKGIEKGYGGGVCQVSTTLYLAAIYANMDITAQRNHSYTVTYADPGYDAAVSDGGQDLQFKNNRKYPVKITAVVTGNSITMSIYGTKLAEEDYKVTLNAETVETRPIEERIDQNPELAPGTKNKISNGQIGYLVNTYKTVTLNGQVVLTKKIVSSYKMLPRVYEVGPDAPPAEPPAAPPQETPAPPAETPPTE